MLEDRNPACKVIFESDYNPEVRDILLLDKYDCQDAIHRATGLDAYIDTAKREIQLFHPVTGRAIGTVYLETSKIIPIREQDRARLDSAYEVATGMARIAKVEKEIHRLEMHPPGLVRDRIAALTAYVERLRNGA